MDDLTEQARQEYLANDETMHEMHSRDHWGTVDAALGRMAADPHWHPVDGSSQQQQQPTPPPAPQIGGRR